ncbi:MAG: response regulator [Myxococcales bacterium]|nr:response regulator [Myxococcales bacterium]
MTTPVAKVSLKGVPVGAIEGGEIPSSVLVVDDEPMILELLTRALSARHLPVKTAASAEDAEKLLTHELFGCLLVDKNLPGVDGIELLRRMRKVQPNCTCIVMTGYASLDSAVEALRLGASDYVQKPFPSLQLVVEKVQIALVNVRVRMERERFLNRIKQFEAELKKRDAQIDDQRTEIDIFNDILEARVADAQADLLKRVQMLSDQLALNIGGDRAAKLSAEAALDIARELQRREDAAPLRADLARIVRQLEDHLKLLR